MTTSDVTNPDATPQEPTALPPVKKGRWWELPVLAILAVAAAVTVKTYIIQPYHIVGTSMETTLHGCSGCNGDTILVNKTSYDVGSPHPGDIIVFSRPREWPRDLDEPAPPKTNVVTGPLRWFGSLVGVLPPARDEPVKRVIAVGGQTIKCCDAQGRVQVSDHGTAGPYRSLNEPYVYPTTAQAMVFGPVIIPHGRLWVMGDHRNDSADSRFHCVPNDTHGTVPAGQACDPISSTVPLSAVLGKAVIVAWPASRWRTLGTPHTFKAKALAGAAALTAGFPPTAAASAVLPLWLWRRRTRTTRRP